MKYQECEVVIRLIGNRAPCHAGHKIGEEWVFDYMTPGGFCSLAYNAIYPFALTLRMGGTFPWQKDPDVVYASCPDPEVGNVFEIRRRRRAPKPNP
ncbi:MAG: TIGR04076 family protein [Dehalococcoidales bacterium]|nr:TIGR04076 family protein [Dehalococcoidales bacterium]